MSINRRLWLRGAALPWTAALIGGLFVGPGGPWAQSRQVASGADGPRGGGGKTVKIGLLEQGAFCHLPLVVAQHNGFFSDEGLQVQLRTWPSAQDALAALEADEAHVLAAPFALSLMEQARGRSLRSFVLQARTPQVALGALQDQVPQVGSLADLRGKKIGVQALGGLSHQVAVLALARQRLGPDQVQFVALDSSAQALEAVRSGAVDALSYSDPLITQLETEAGFRVLLDTRSVRGSEALFGGVLPTTCLAARPSFLDAQAEVCQALTHGVVRALHWLQNASPSDLNRRLPDAWFAGDRSLSLAAFDRARGSYSPDGLMPISGPAVAQKTLTQLGLTLGDKPLDLTRSFTNQWAQVAKQRYRL